MAVDIGTDTPWTGRKTERLVRIIDEGAPRDDLAARIPPGADVLDVGAGNGALEAHLHGDYTSLDWEADLDPDIVADSRNMPCDDGEYDVVVCKSHLIHVQEWRQTVMEMLRVAADRVVVQEVAWTGNTVISQDEPVHCWLFNQDDLIETLSGEERRLEQVKMYESSDQRMVTLVRDL